MWKTQCPADVTVWQHQNRDKPGAMPEWLRLRRRERWLSQRNEGGGEYVILDKGICAVFSGKRHLCRRKKPAKGYTLLCKSWYGELFV